MLPVAVRLGVMLLAEGASVPPANKLGAPSVAVHPTQIVVPWLPPVRILEASGQPVAL